MIREDKELLLKELCARLPYGVKCHFKYGSAEDDVTLSCIDNNIARFEYGWYGKFHISIDADYIKPYLRSMSSMTEEERNIYCSLKMQETERVALAEVYCPEAISEIMDWLNAHYFDYRGLIEKGLAIEAPKDMYKEE